MKMRMGPSLWDKKIREDSVKYLFWKGAGGLFTAGIAVVVAWAAVGSFNISNTVRLSEELTQKNLQLNNLTNERDSLRSIVAGYQTKRFMIHKRETKVLFWDVYFNFKGDTRNEYSIYKFMTPVKSEMNLPQAFPDTFLIDGKSYYLITERIFLSTNFLADSALIYWDSLDRDKPQKINDLR